jgi:2-keto-3-deoxy-L-rhamnonate aldolase RhmA
MRVNHVRRRLKAGEPSVGSWLSLPSPEAARCLGQIGFDWLTVDAGGRHGSLTPAFSEGKDNLAGKGLNRLLVG